MNYKYYFIVVFFLFNSLSGSAKEKYSWYIAISTRDCIHCVDGIRKINQLSTKYPKTIVFSKLNKPDSEALIHRLFLRKFKGKIEFNDQLFQKFKNKSNRYISSVTLYNNLNKHYITVPLAALSNNDDIDLNRFFQHKDTFSLKSDAFTRSSSVFFSSNCIYILDYLISEIKVFNRISLSESKVIKLTDNLLLKGYKAKFGDKDGVEFFQNSIEFVKKRHLVGSQARIMSMTANLDTLRLSVRAPYPPVPVKGTEDSIINSFPLIYTFVSGKFFSVAGIETSTRDSNGVLHPAMKRGGNQSKDGIPADRKHYFLGGKFFFYKNRLYNTIGGSYLVENGHNRAVAEFSRNKYGNWTFERYVGDLPQFYIKHRVGYNSLCATSFHNGSYYAFLYGDKLHSVDKNKPDIQLGFLPKVSNAEPTGNWKEANKIMVEDFKINGDTLYLLAGKSMGQLYFTYYYIYDIVHKKVLFTREFNEKQLPGNFNFPCIDPLDYAYIITEISPKKLLRLKAESVN